jgi:hypothetical protein
MTSPEVPEKPFQELTANFLFFETGAMVDCNHVNHVTV